MAGDCQAGCDSNAAPQGPRCGKPGAFARIVSNWLTNHFRQPDRAMCRRFFDEMHHNSA
jgi:hypothetical protein